MKNIKLSYCTTCCDRLWQLALSLPDNLKKLNENEEFILVNYGSTDNLTRYIQSSYLCNKLIEENRFKYIDVLDVNKYHCPKAKNIAHRFATGNFLINLDADNSNHLINKTILNTVGKNKALIHLWSHVTPDGTYGKICIPKNIFYKLGGYDESLLPIAYQDNDIIERAKAMNIEIIRKPILVNAIPNTDEEKINKTGVESWWGCLHANRDKSNLNISKNNLIANKDTGWGYAKAKINFGKLQEFKEIFPEVQ
jgi:hypothetical protein